MPAQLAEDRRRGERPQRRGARRVVAADRRDQAHEGDLLEIVGGLARVRVAARERHRERLVAPDELVEGGAVAVLAQALDQLLVAEVAGIVWGCGHGPA